MLGQRRRRRANIKSALALSIVFAGMLCIWSSVISVYITYPHYSPSHFLSLVILLTSTAINNGRWRPTLLVPHYFRIPQLTLQLIVSIMGSYKSP